MSVYVYTRGMTSVAIEEHEFVASDMELSSTHECVPSRDSEVVTESSVGNSALKDQWNIHSTNIRECWAKWGTKGAGARVAVIDSGVRSTHKDLATCLKGSYDYTHDQAPMNEDTDHGTHVCGIIGAADNGDLVTGVAPECEIHSFKIFGRGKSCRNENIIRALRDIKNKKYGDFDVVNMSIGCPVPDHQIRMELQELCAQGVICVAASGNSGDHSASSTPRFGTTDFPAAYDSTLCVGATKTGSSRSVFTSTGPCLHILAPGENILSTWDTADTAFATCSGTSMATPFVSGVIALLVSYCKKTRLPRPGLNQAIYLSLIHI